MQSLFRELRYEHFSIVNFEIISQSFYQKILKNLKFLNGKESKRFKIHSNQNTSFLEMPLFTIAISRFATIETRNDIVGNVKM